MADTLDQAKLSSPRIFLIRMLVFLILCGLIAFVLQHQILNAFMANPWLNGLIVGVLLIGIVLSFHRVIRLFPEVSWVNSFRGADPAAQPPARAPTLLAPMASILGGERAGRVAISAQTMRAFLDSLASRLDEARDISRYLTGLLVFLGLLGTFWGLIETVGSVGNIINNLSVGGDADTVFNTLKEGLAAPLGGMGISFSSSLFGLAGSLVLGFLDLQTSQAQNRFYNNLEDWLATTVQDLGAVGAGTATDTIERLRQSVGEAGSGKATTAAMANLAEAIQGLVQHMRAEQQMIREWADAQAKMNGDIRRLLETLSRESVD
ncbi:MAG: flagellar motor protein MotA [Xanthobacteraceae bacterium]|nr:flagellar motor protein MotA [Xanthobacteraceae bacterium]